MELTPYTIRQVAEAAGVSAHTLRYYEQAGVMIDVPRHSNGHRRYGDRHIRWVRFLRRLRLAGMSMAQVRTYARLVRGGEESMPRRAAMLAEHRNRVRERIAELNEHLAIVEKKLQTYVERGVACEPD